MNVVLTDLGLVSALGRGRDDTSVRLFAGSQDGMRKISLSGGDVSFFGEARLPDEAFASAPTRVAALLDEAVSQLRLDDLFEEVPPERVGAVVGTSNSTMEEFTERRDEIDMAYPAKRLRERWGVQGPALSVSTACSSSAKAFASARNLLLSNVCDAVVVGGADAKTRTVIEGFHALESLSPNLTRPLSPDRDGINLGEGAAFFVLRRAGEAKKRVLPRGVVLLGVGESSDAYHLTAPDPEGKGAFASMEKALQEARLKPEDVGYVNLHGTGTVYNDAMECAAVRRLFSSRIPVSSTKPLTGHCLGAAGALEAALCVLTLLRGGGLPPHQVAAVDRELAPFPVPRVGDATRVRTVLSNSFAFGGSNASLVLGLREEEEAA